jgi:hypothetical protein
MNIVKVIPDIPDKINNHIPSPTTKLLRGESQVLTDDGGPG